LTNFEQKIEQKIISVETKKNGIFVIFLKKGQKYIICRSENLVKKSSKKMTFLSLFFKCQKYIIFEVKILTKKVQKISLFIPWNKNLTNFRQKIEKKLISVKAKKITFLSIFSKKCQKYIIC